MRGFDRAAAVTVEGDSVLFPLEPYEDESYFGFTCRLASWNSFENRRGLLKALGFEHPHVSDIHQAASDDGRFAWRLGITPEQLGRLTARELGDEYRKEFHLRKRRVSPRGLNQSPHHRSSWTIARLPYCPSSWDFLISKCTRCSHELGWSTLAEVHICERCDFDLRRARPISVPAIYRTSLGFLADLATVDPLTPVLPGSSIPAVLVGETRLRVFRLIHRVGRGVAVQDGFSNFDRAAEVTKAKYLARGVELLQGYPESFDAMFTGGNDPLPRQLTKLRAGLGGRTEPGMLFDRLLADWEPCRHGLKRLQQEREIANSLTVREAAKELHIENMAVRRLIDRGLIQPLDSRGTERRYDWLRKEDVGLVADKLAARLSPREFSRANHIPLYGTLQLVASGLLALSDCPFVTALHGRPQLIRPDADAFVARLRSVIHFPKYGCETLSLEDAFYGVGGQQKPWSAIIRAALERRLELYWNDDPHAPFSVKGLHISRQDAKDLVARRRPELLEAPVAHDECLIPSSLSRGEVEQYLNCFPRDLTWLLCHGRLSAEFPIDQVEELGRQLISSREISWRWRVSPALRDALPSEHGIARCTGPFWPRAEVEAFFARRFP